jgi:predicted 3-demethylubiquinone-9 3-methyltransferase (glyoxalase superfamily)
MRKIVPCLWFDNEAEEAVNFYTSLFKDSKIISISRYGEGAPKPAGTALTVIFQMNGQEFMALNGGPEFKFTEAVSLFVDCESQQEVDNYWAKLTADGGEESQCGWLKDKYGLSWQIVPNALGGLLSDPDPAKSKKVFDALMQMRKIDIATLERAYEQG